MKQYRVTVDGKTFNVVVEETAEQEMLHGVSTPHREPAPPVPARAEKGPAASPAGGSLRVEAPMPGAIIDIAVSSGEGVEAGDVLLILEAMKMENEITAPRRGTVGDIHVKVGDTVSGGEPLMEIT